MDEQLRLYREEQRRKHDQLAREGAGQVHFAQDQQSYVQSPHFIQTPPRPEPSAPPEDLTEQSTNRPLYPNIHEPIQSTNKPLYPTIPSDRQKVEFY